MKRICLAFAVLAAVPLALAACGGQDQAKTAAPDEVWNLAYAASESAPATYRATYDQNLEMGKDKTQKARRTLEADYVMQQEALPAGVKAYIILDRLSASEVDGDDRVELDTAQFPGKSLVLAMDRKGGRPNRLTPLPSLDFGLPGGEKLDSSLLFGYAFPRLPDVPPKEGDSWRESISEKRLEGDFLVDSSYTMVHTYAGTEEIDHVSCMKVESTCTGHIRGTQEREGKRWSYTGTLEGTATWYFDTEHGALVKYQGTESSDGKEITSGASIPVTQETKIDIVRVPEA